MLKLGYLELLACNLIFLKWKFFPVKFSVGQAQSKFPSHLLFDRWVQGTSTPK